MIKPLTHVNGNGFSSVSNMQSSDAQINLGHSVMPTEMYGQLMSDAGWMAKLQYDVAKMDLSLHRKQQDYWMREEHEKRIQDIKTKSKVQQDMRYCKILSNDAGEIFVAVTDSDAKELVVKRLFHNTKIRAKRLVAYYPERICVLRIECEGIPSNNLSFKIDGSVSTNLFLKRLKSSGMCMQVSARLEKQVAAALWTYFLSSVEEYEIPGVVGWNKMQDGRWHFARVGEIVMKEVL